MSSASHDEVVAPRADLLPELCDHVLDGLDAVSVTCFPAACTTWAAASRTSTPRLRSGTPTLLTSGLDPDGYDVEYDVETGTFGLHDVAGGKSFYGEAQRLRNRTWIGGKDDWPVTTDLRCSVELLNPMTGDRAPLPSFTTIPRLEVDAYLHVAVNNQLHLFQQVTLCRTPAHPNGHLAIALFSGGPLGLLAFTAHGDEGWTPLMNPAGAHYLKYTDATVHNGKVVAVAESGDIYSWDMMDGATAEPTLLPRPEIHHVSRSHDLRRGFYLAKSSAGQLQVVCMYGHGDVRDKRSRRIVFKEQWSFFVGHVSLHELDVASGAWRHVRDLGGDRALFVGENYPFYATVPPGGSHDLQADSVYVADLLGCDAAFFDLKLGDDYIYDFEGRLSYPAMGDSLQMPMWFRPTAYPIA